MKNPRSAIPLLLAALVGIAVLGYLIFRPTAPDEARPAAVELPAAPAGPAAGLSALASAPDWSELDAWQETVEREEFITMMDEVFTVSPAWRDWFRVADEEVMIRTGNPDQPYVLRFASSDDLPGGPRYWRPAEALPTAPEGRPLEGLRITIDPGHIGGRWATIEERWFQVGNARPVQEGDMTLRVARLLKPRLERLGAEVSLVRSRTEPLTSDRPETLLGEAGESDSGKPGSARKLAERLFYRTSEIRARADRVNRILKPDLVLCLHFNADAWGDPNLPTLVPANHFHMIVNGAYMDGEVALEDQRFAIVRKIVDRIHPEEAALAASVAQAFVESTGLPPYQYEVGSLRALNIGHNPYLWARNLLANRLYDCPVVFLEPYVMNSLEDHARIQLGDYEGLKEVSGKRRPSIFREYADAVATGLANHYRAIRSK